MTDTETLESMAHRYTEMGFERKPFLDDRYSDIYEVHVPTGTNFYAYLTEPPYEYFNDDRFTENHSAGPFDVTFEPMRFKCKCDVRLTNRHNVCLNEYQESGMTTPTIATEYCSSKCSIQIGRVNQYVNARPYRFLCIHAEVDLEQMPEFDYLVGKRRNNLAGISSYAELFRRIIVDLAAMGFDGIIYRNPPTLYPFIFDGSELALKDVLLNREEQIPFFGTLAYMKSGHEAMLFYRLKRDYGRNVASRVIYSATACIPSGIPKTKIESPLHPALIPKMERLPDFLRTALTE